MTKSEKSARAHFALAIFYGVIFAIGLLLSLSSANLRGTLLVTTLVVVGPIFAIHFFTSRACRKASNSGRRASQIVGFFMLLGFPLGTIIGIYLLINSWNAWGPEYEPEQIRV